MSASKQTNILDLCDINPGILHCSFFPSSSFKRGTRLGQRYVYDYEIEYISEGDGDGYIVIDGKEYHVKQGDVVLRRPGSRVEGVMPYSGYTIHFDPSGKTQVNAQEYWDTRCNKIVPVYSMGILDGIPIITHSSDEKLLSFFISSYHNFINPGSISPLIHRSNMLSILCQLYIDISTDFPALSIHASAYYTKVKKVVEYISFNYNLPLALYDLAKLTGLSPNYFHKIFTKTTGKTLNEFITEVRINKAKELLLNTTLKISVIAEKCGFDNASYFSSVFRKKSKINPNDFRIKFLR